MERLPRTLRVETPYFEPLSDGGVRVHFGGSRGYKEFPTYQLALEAMGPWVETRLTQLENEKHATAKFLADLCVAFEQDKARRTFPPKG